MKIAAQIRFDWPPGPYLNPFVEKTLEEEEVHEGLFRLVFHPRSHRNLLVQEGLFFGWFFIPDLIKIF